MATSPVRDPDAIIRRVERLTAEYIACIDDGRLEAWPDFFLERCLYKIISRDNYARDMPVGLV
jgi:anthranilate 1,2-dioxygenase small subunit